MAWTLHLDQASQACLDRLTSAISLHTQTISQTGKNLMAELEDLEGVAKVLAEAGVNVANAINEAVSELPQLTARIADLVAQLAAAVNTGDSARIAAVTAQLSPLAGQLNDEAVALKSAADAAASALPQPVPAPEPVPAA